MDDKDIRQGGWQGGYPCPLGAETGPQIIIVRQVVAEQQKQKVLDIHIEVPPNKPAIEQIVDVFVKNLEINCVDVIHDKVIVRGEFEVKAVYVARLPNNPVHAIEIKHYRWTQDIDMPGARRGMDADASVIIEFVDYDVDEHSRAYKYKYEDMSNNHDDHDDECDDHDDDDCGHDDHDDHEDHGSCNGGHHHHHHHHHVCRDFDISIVLKVVAKVMTSREVQIGGFGTVPTGPKG